LVLFFHTQTTLSTQQTELQRRTNKHCNEYHSNSRSIATNQPVRWVAISTRGEFG